MEQSNCCGASRLWETDICDRCKEHADFADWEQFEEQVYNKTNKSFINKLKNFWEQWKVPLDTDNYLKDPEFICV